MNMRMRNCTNSAPSRSPPPLPSDTTGSHGVAPPTCGRTRARRARAGGGGGRGRQMERVRDGLRGRKYEAHREFLRESGAPHADRRLFHGTSAETVPKILRLVRTPPPLLPRPPPSPPSPPRGRGRGHDARAHPTPSFSICVVGVV